MSTIFIKNEPPTHNPTARLAEKIFRSLRFRSPFPEKTKHSTRQKPSSANSTAPHRARHGRRQGTVGKRSEATAPYIPARGANDTYGSSKSAGKGPDRRAPAVNRELIRTFTKAKPTNHAQAPRSDSANARGRMPAVRYISSVPV